VSAPARRLPRTKLGAVLLVLIALAAAWHFGVFASVREPSELARRLLEMGAWGYLAFIAAYTVLQPFGVPGTVYVVAAPLIWPWHIAFALSLVGTLSASVVGFSFARFVARDWVSARIPARLRKYDDALASRAFQTVVILRLIFWMPQVLHSFFGVSQLGFWTHFWGSLVGYVPPLLLVSYLGASMFDGSGRLQPAAWPVMAGLLIASLIMAALARAYGRRRLSQEPPPPQQHCSNS
jgi:uncharacterized membrane protein YdjX (TVP38/TMEM64 family)